MNDKPTNGKSYDIFSPGKTYRITKDFTDYIGQKFSAGKEFVYLDHSFLPYDDGLILIVEIDGDKLADIRLQGDDSEQGEIRNNFGRYFQKL